MLKVWESEEQEDTGSAKGFYTFWRMEWKMNLHWFQVIAGSIEKVPVEQGSANYCPGAKSSPWFVFIWLRAKNDSDFLSKMLKGCKQTKTNKHKNMQETYVTWKA